MMEFLQIIIWPVIFLIIAIIFIVAFRKPLIQLIDRTKSIKSGKFGLDTSSTDKQAQQKDEKKLKLEEIERELNLFNKETRQYFQNLIKEEAKWDKTNSNKERFEILLKYSEALYIIFYFERIYNLIFGSQITILKRLNAGVGLKKENIKKAYENTLLESNEALKGYPFDQYFNFLERYGLVTIEDEFVKITWLGRDFLKYLIDKGLEDHKAN